MKVVVKELNEFTAGIVCRYPQDDRINYLYGLLEFNAESELDAKLVEKVKKGLFPNNIYDVDIDLIDGSIATMYALLLLDRCLLKTFKRLTIYLLV